MLISVSGQSLDDNSSEHLFSSGMTAAIKENIPKLLIKSVSFVIYKRVWKLRQALVDMWRITLLTSNTVCFKSLSLTLRCSAGVRICSGSIPREGTTSPPQICETACPKPVHNCHFPGLCAQAKHIHTHNCSQWIQALGLWRDEGLQELGQKSH